MCRTIFRSSATYLVEIITEHCIVKAIIDAYDSKEAIRKIKTLYGSGIQTIKEVRTVKER
jgi:cation transport ATPase